MLSGSRGDSTSVTKYPYVSPLPEAPSRLECYWYVDVSSRTETIGAPFESIMSAANASHPFSIPFSVFLLDCLCLCMSGWLPKGGYAAVCLLYPAATVAKYRSTRVTLEYPFPSSLSVSLLSLPYYLLISSPARSYAQASPTPRSSCILGGERDLLRLIPILETLPPHSRSIAPSYVFPLSFFFWNLWVSSSLVYVLPKLISILLSSFARSRSRLGISGENQLFPYVPKWINRHKTEEPQIISVIKNCMYISMLSDFYIVFFIVTQNDYCYYFSEFLTFRNRQYI